MFLSAAMRCPKCRSDMEQIDRCATCGGIWLDAGEVEQLRNRAARAAIDTGDARTGREQNSIVDYKCPRCNSALVLLADPQQPHISYEVCSECIGAFFDAGEFRDLANLTVADFFKKLIARNRV